MKRLFVASGLFIFFSFGCWSLAEGADWKLFFRDPSASNYYIDTDSKENLGEGVVRAWEEVLAPDEEEFASVDVVKTLHYRNRLH